MQNTNQTYQFKVGDKVKYKESERDKSFENLHIPDFIYTVQQIIHSNVVFFEESSYPCKIHRLEPAYTNRHKHADLMIAYANNTSLEIQYREDESYEWNDCTQGPNFFEMIQYRIKPKTVTKYQVLYTMTEYQHAKVTGDYFSSEEDFNSAGYTNVKFIQLIKETAKEFDVN